MEREIAQGALGWGILLGWVAYWLVAKITRIFDLWMLRNEVRLKQAMADSLDRMQARLDEKLPGDAEIKGFGVENYKGELVP
jgi:hypothetical protein